MTENKTNVVSSEISEIRQGKEIIGLLWLLSLAFGGFIFLTYALSIGKVPVLGLEQLIIVLVLSSVVGLAVVIGFVSIFYVGPYFLYMFLLDKNENKQLETNMLQVIILTTFVQAIVATVVLPYCDVKILNAYVWVLLMFIPSLIGTLIFTRSEIVKMDGISTSKKLKQILPKIGAVLCVLLLQLLSILIMIVYVLKSIRVDENITIQVVVVSFFFYIAAVFFAYCTINKRIKYSMPITILLVVMMLFLVPFLADKSTLVGSYVYKKLGFGGYKLNEVVLIKNKHNLQGCVKIVQEGKAYCQLGEVFVHWEFDDEYLISETLKGTVYSISGDEMKSRGSRLN